MKRFRLWLSTLTALVAVAFPGMALAAGGGGAPIVIVADTRRLEGLMAWWGGLYNESHLQFMLLTVALIPVIGVIFGVLADAVMGFVGLDLSSKSVHH